MTQKTTSELERNTTASFAYVKKDILMLNDAFSDLFNKLQNLAGRIEAIETRIAGCEEKNKKAVKKVSKKRRR